MKFANFYWSPDYKSGIDRLSKQSIRSINQLHELHHLVLNYMNYCNMISDQALKICVDAYPFESPFRAYDPSVKLTLPEPKTTLKRISDSFLGGSEEVKSPSRNSHVHDASTTEVNMTTAFESYVKNLNKQSQEMSRLAIVIDREILEKITTFIKANEPQLRSIIDEFARIVVRYNECLKYLEDLKNDYDELSNMKEKDLPQPPQEDEELDHEEVKQEKKETVSTPFDSLKFPLLLGPLNVSDPGKMQTILNKLMSNMKTVKKKILIPGYKNEVFSSDQFSDYLMKLKPFSFNPTRLNVEKFGQALVDLKLMVNSNMFFAGKFKGEGMWFEWSDLAILMAKYEELGYQSEHPEKIDKTPTIGVTPAFMSSTSKMFQSVKLSLMTKRNYSEKLTEIEELYADNYVTLQDLQNTLNTKIINHSDYLETFERAKIDVVYTLLSKLCEITYNHSLNATNNMHAFTKSFLETIDTKEAREADFHQLLLDFSTGVFGAPAHSLVLHVQNLKNKFNLNKDFQLQVQVRGEILSLSSLPCFVHEMLPLGDNFSQDEWKAPLNHLEYHNQKQEVADIVNEVTHFEITSETKIHCDIIHKIVLHLNQNRVNFIKNWLLEMADSLIPCMFLDTIVNLYKNTNMDVQSLDNDARRTELIRLLSTAPRANLSTLIYLLEHVAGAFGINTLEDYGKSDEVKEPEADGDRAKIEETADILNSMEEIGSVPFVHLILRPSILKTSSGYKPPLVEYKHILMDLLSPKLRFGILQKLLMNENNFKAKKEREQEKFKAQVKKIPEQLPPQIQSPKIRENAIPLLAPQENFTLRPFRTNATPNPSPLPSPLHTPRNLQDLEAKFKKHNLGGHREPAGRARSASNLLLPSGVDVEFGDE